MSWRRVPNELIEDARLHSDVFDKLPSLLPIGGGQWRGPRYYTGIKALMLAVLEDGVRCYLGSVGRRQTDAEFWMTQSRRDWPFGFAVVCDILGLDAQAVRRALGRMRNQRRSERRIRRPRSRPNVRRRGPLMPTRTSLGQPRARSATTRADVVTSASPKLQHHVAARS